MQVFDFQPKFKKTILKNGIRVVTEHHPYTRASSAAIFLNLGTRDEPNEMAGAAHFIEHMVFKGTKKRTALEIAQELEAVGGEINAYTTREYTCYHSTTLREHLSLSLDVLSDLVKQATFKSEDFELERSVILQEIEMSDEQFEEYIFDMYFNLTYQGHDLGTPILGTRESIAQMTRKELYQFYKNFYSTDRMIVAVAGDVDHEEVVRFVKRRFPKNTIRDLKTIRQLSKRKKAKEKVFKKFIKKPTEQVHVLMGFPAASFKDKYRFEAYMTNTILGGGMTSRLYQEVREKKGLAYSIYSYLNSFTDSGLLLFYGATSQEKYKEVIEGFKKEIQKLYKKGVSKKELSFFKKQVTGQILLGADDIDNRLNSIAVNEMIFGQYRPVEKVLKDIESVTQESMNQFLKKYLKLEKASWIILGDLSEKPDWSQI